VRLNCQSRLLLPSINKRPIYFMILRIPVRLSQNTTLFLQKLRSYFVYNQGVIGYSSMDTVSIDLRLVRNHCHIVRNHKNELLAFLQAQRRLDLLVAFEERFEHIVQ
jgi:hypothetical protein